MSAAARILPHYTYEDWINWVGHWEIIDGIPYAMSPMQVPKHQVIANSIGAEFYIALKGCKQCKASQALDYKIAEDTIVQPDFLVVCNEIQKKFLDFPPALVLKFYCLPHHSKTGIPNLRFMSSSTLVTILSLIHRPKR